MVAPKRRNGVGECHRIRYPLFAMVRSNVPNLRSYDTFRAVANNVWLEHRRTITNHTFLQVLILMESGEHAGGSCFFRFYFLVFPTNLAAQE